jgi:uncharacterized linocin/CFP29 family protein
VDLLKRRQAPILDVAWAAIDDEAKRVLTLHLAARKLVDFEGPFGWEFAAVNTGRLIVVENHPVARGRVGKREVQQVIEIRTPIQLDIMDLDMMGRGEHQPDLTHVVEAAEQVAHFEDRAIFHGEPALGITGILQASPHKPVRVTNPSAWPLAIVEATEVLREAGINGPYALALGPKAYSELSVSMQGEYPVRKRIERELIGRPIVWAPALQGAVLLSVRGGDFVLSVGEDLSIGYAFHDKHKVELYLTESFAFRVLDPAAAVALGTAAT